MTNKREAGRQLAERLGLKIIGTEGHDLKVACSFCPSSDAGRIHEDTGAYFCFSCQKGFNGFDLCKKMGHDHKAAVAIMREVGLFQDYMSAGGNGHAAPIGGNGKAGGGGDLLAEIAAAKNCTVAGFKRFGAVVKGDEIWFPQVDENLALCTVFWMSHKELKGRNFKNGTSIGKGRVAKGTGIFLPSEVEPYKPRKPKPGETWVLVEGCKDASVLSDLGFLAVGLPGNRMKAEFAPLFKDADVVTIADGDKAGKEGAAITAKLLRGVARSVKVGAWPDGKDARDVLHEQGPEGIGRVIMAASEGGDGSDGPPIPSPCSLPELVLTHPVMRAAVISGLLRMGETMNLVAAPKKGKSWLVYDLGLSVASGCRWLETFPCVQGRVLILDAELHPEVIAHRLPAVAEALGIAPEWLGWIDILPLRGLGVDLLRLESFIETIEAGRYALIILDAWYRFLPLGYSENDNAQVMALYNKIDTYAARLGAAWVNIHHASKGDQSGKGTTDVGSGAGSQSRAADTHLIICAHEQDDVSVIEAVVRSWPPVEPIAIRWTFPVWQLDTTADPRRLQKPRERANQESRGTRLDGDRQLIVNAMVHNPDLQTKTDIRDSSGFGNPRFGFAWASLLADKTIIPSGEVIKGNNRKYESFILLHKETEE